MSLLVDIYDKAPHWLQDVFLNAYSAGIHLQRYGRPFRRAFAHLGETEWFSPDQIAQYQTLRLREIVRHAYETVPFYRRLYARHGIVPEDVKELGDIAKLPLLTREDVREAGKELMSRAYPLRKLVHGHTSGTTGSPLSFYWCKQTCVYTNAVDWRQKLWGGVRYGEPIALFLGRTVVPTRRTTPPFWQHDRIHNMLWMSSFHLGEPYLPFYLDKLRQFRPAAVEGYPSTLYILARYLEQTGQTLPVKAVFSSSETLLPLQRALIEERFEADVFDFYGLAERVAFATQCAEAREYHLNFEYALNEVVDSEGNAMKEGEEGFLVGTSLLNFGMPFIRYRTTDVTALHTGRCACGRHMPRLQKVTTKEEDIVVTPEGRHVSSSVLTHPFKPLDWVRESQIVQERLDSLRIKIVRRAPCSGNDTERLIAAMQERVGPTMRIAIEFVDEIPRTQSGKLRWVISKVPLRIGPPLPDRESEAIFKDAV